MRVMASSRVKLSVNTRYVLFATILLLFLWSAVIQIEETDVSPKRAENECNNKIINSKPRPLVVVAAGMPRSGSTVLFNALRILMRMRDPNTISGWHTDLTRLIKRRAEESTVESFRSVGASLLVKIHTVAEWGEFQWGWNRAGSRGMQLGSEVDLVFTSYRDVRKAVISVRRMGFGCEWQADQLDRSDYCTTPTRCKRWLKFSDYRNATNWALLGKSIIFCRDRMLQAAGDTLADDVELGKLQFRDNDHHSARILLARLGRHLNYCYSSDELEIAARELLGITPPNSKGPLKIHPNTQLHRGHVASVQNRRISDSQSKVDGIKAIENDPILSKWLKSNGYPIGN